MKILFVTVDGGGNIPPQLGTARTLRSRGAEVRFLGHSGIADRIIAAQFPFEPFETGVGFDPLAPRPLLAMMRDFSGMVVDRRIGRDAVAVARREAVDLVVADTMVAAGISELVAAGVPTVSFVHCFYRAVQDMAASPVGLQLRLKGLSFTAVQQSTALQIVAARADLDPVRGRPAVRHVGVVWQGKPVATERQAVPRILVSLSTNAFAGQHSMLQRILDAIADLRGEVIVTRGPAIDTAGLRVPRNAEVHDWLDHDDVLRSTSLLVGHGGHSTTMRALSFGVPVLVIPANPLIDQRAVGKAITRAGVGAALPKHASVRRIADAVRSLLADQQVIDSATALGEDIRRRDGAELAADAIEEAIGARSTA